MRHGDMLGWVHNFLQVDPSHWRIKVSGIVPRQREHGWRWELAEMRNSKCWCGFVHMAMNTMKFPLVVLVQQELANVTAGESSMSHAVDAQRRWLKLIGRMKMLLQRRWRCSLWSNNKLSKKLKELAVTLLLIRASWMRRLLMKWR